MAIMLNLMIIWCCVGEMRLIKTMDGSTENYDDDYDDAADDDDDNNDFHYFNIILYKWGNIV